MKTVINRRNRDGDGTKKTQRELLLKFSDKKDAESFIKRIQNEVEQYNDKQTIIGLDTLTCTIYTDKPTI